MSDKPHNARRPDGTELAARGIQLTRKGWRCLGEQKLIRMARRIRRWQAELHCIHGRPAGRMCPHCMAPKSLQ